MNVNQDEYLSEGDDAAGMRLVIHQTQRMPFPEDEGLAINPGQTTSIGLRQVGETSTIAIDFCQSIHTKHSCLSQRNRATLRIRLIWKNLLSVIC